MRKARMLLAVVALIVAPPSSGSGENDAVGVPGFDRPPVRVEDHAYATVEHFLWKEFDDGGARIVKESGPRYGAGIARSYFRDVFTLRPRFEVFGGKVSYDGRTQTGVPASTDTTYAGLKAEGDVGGIVPVGKRVAIEPFAGLGYTYWTRDLENTPVAYGATERWDSLYFRAGLRAEHRPDSSSSVGTFGSVGVRMPFYNRNRVDIKGAGKASLEPGKDPGLVAELGARYGKLMGSIYYEGMRFTKSRSDVFPLDNTRALHVWQPRSTADIIGVRLGLLF